jgi:hypothetical protein
MRAAIHLFPITADDRRLLELLAAADDGATDALLLAKGFTVYQMVGLVRAGLATAEPEHIFATGRPVEISRVRITGAGRRALVERRR